MRTAINSYPIEVIMPNFVPLPVRRKFLRIAAVTYLIVTFPLVGLLFLEVRTTEASRSI